MILFHGSPTLINDEHIASGTFFSSDLLVALEYGGYIYAIDDSEVPTRETEKILGNCLLICAVPKHKFILMKVL